MSKEAIVEKILTDAQRKAEAMVGEARNQADAILASADEQCKAYSDACNLEIDNLALAIDSRSQTVAELDGRKMLASAKAHLLDLVFDRALQKCKQLDNDTYAKLVLGMLDNAQDGDVVTISEREKDIITPEVVKEVAKAKGIKLTLNKQLGDFDAGIVLSGGGVDRNFTIGVEIGLIRDEMEAQIAKELFD